MEPVVNQPKAPAIPQASTPITPLPPAPPSDTNTVNPVPIDPEILGNARKPQQSDSGRKATSPPEPQSERPKPRQASRSSGRKKGQPKPPSVPAIVDVPAPTTHTADPRSDPAFDTVPSPLLKALSDEQIRAVLQAMNPRYRIKILDKPTDLLSNSLLSRNVENLQNVAGHDDSASTASLAKNSAARKDVSDTPVPTPATQEVASRTARVGGRKKRTIVAPAIEPPQPSSSAAAADPHAPRGSNRLREKGKVTYSARRGIIKPPKRSGEFDLETQGSRKRTAL